MQVFIYADYSNKTETGLGVISIPCDPTYKFSQHIKLFFGPSVSNVYLYLLIFVCVSDINGDFLLFL